MDPAAAAVPGAVLPERTDGPHAASTPLSPQSPNAIPPRTSSTGYAQPHPPSKSALRPLSESNWLGQTAQRHRKSSSATAIPLTGMQGNSPPDPTRFATEDHNIITQRQWTTQKEKVLQGPYEYLFSIPGKDFRTLMVTSFNVWLDVPKDSLDIITKVVGMLHTSSLLIDDVEDNSVLRRGLPVTHSIYGTAQTINSANYIYFCALQELQKLKNPRAIDVYTEELLNLHRGQGMDLFWRDTLTCPTEEDYLEMVGNKTGGLFRLAVRLMQAESKSSIDCVPLVHILGLIFQIEDDYKNLSDVKYTENKGFAEDLTEGKFSFPIIHSIRSDPNNLQLLNILKQKTTDAEVKRYAIRYMESTGSFEYTRRVLEVLIDRARKITNEIDAGQGKTQGVNKILDKMVLT
ncbi:geranylgeranyl pyrophosphate synthetase [Diatrype stigma]|uniref:Geranylgeranyl pyrophosphate synthetase n=1 Tax=Diatrype stigma TaxID=117547 RepID=A0AAN9YUD1_9PEZI